MNHQLKGFRFSAEKNKLLQEQRGVSFEEIIAAIESGKVLDILANSNSDKYPVQQIYVIKLNNYVYYVPFLKELKGGLFLKTIIPSRKLTKIYLRKI